VVRQKNKEGIVFSYFLVSVLFIIAGCNDKVDNEFDSDITAAATLKIYKACKLPNEKFCDSECCESEEKCGNQIMYKKCDLESGEWQTDKYTNNQCTTICDAANSENTSDIEQAEEELETCIEGWKCIDKHQRMYRMPNCSFMLTEYCEIGCVDDTCIKLCEPGTLSCRDKVLRMCSEDGSIWVNKEICEFGCEDNKCLENNQDNFTQSNQNKCENSCFEIVEFHYDAEGNDCKNLNDEYLILKNKCSYSCDLTGWSISDASTHSYTFPSFSLGSESTFKLYTGDGIDTFTELYWKSKYTPCKAIWNNDADTLTLKNTAGELILVYNYP